MLQPSTAFLFGIATSDPSGTATFPLPVPTAPWIANQFAVLQAGVIMGTTLQLSGPGFTRIR